MKLSSFYKLFVFFFFLSLSFGASAHDLKLGEISYDITGDSTMSVSYSSEFKSTSKFISIPNSVSYCGGIYSVTRIHDSDFRNCDDLAVLTMPASVTEIDNFAFKGKENISGIICLAQRPPAVDAKSFNVDDFENTTLFVPKESVNAYRTAATWNSFKNIQPFNNRSRLNGDVNGDGYVEIDDVSTLIDMLLNGWTDEGDSDYPELDFNGLLSPQNSRVLPLESMGAELDDIDGGSFDYSPSQGDVFFKNGVDNQIFVYTNGDSIGYPAKAGVLYINKHTLRMYSWNGACMVELGNYYNKRSFINDIDCTDDEFSSFSIGHVGYSLDRKRFELKIGDDQWWYYLPDSTRIYCDASTNTLWRWSNNDESFVPVGGGNIEVVNDLTTGGADKALSAEQGKLLSPLTELIGNQTYPTTTESVRLTKGGRYDANYYTAPVTGYFNPTINNYDNWGYAVIDVKEDDILTIVGSKSGMDYRLYTIVDSDGKRLIVGPSANGQSYTIDSPLTVTMPANAAKVYINLTFSGSSISITRTSFTEVVLKRATVSQDGLMTKDQVAALNNAGGVDVDLLRSYIEERTDVTDLAFVVGNLKNYFLSIGDRYTGGLGDENQSFVYCRLPVRAGDVVSFYCTTDNWNHGYVLCDSNNNVILLSGTRTQIMSSAPTTLAIEEDGTLYIASNKSDSYGGTCSRIYRTFRIATSEHDGLMSKEIAALFGGDVSGDDASSLKLKSFAVIGDSFSAPGLWQSTMCSILGALLKKNMAVSGGAWHGTNSLSAYYQAQALVAAGSECDYILCLLGTNDVAHWSSYTLGDIVNSEIIGTGAGNVNPNSSITGGIQATLITLKNAFPKAIIKIGYTPAGYIHDAFNSIANVEALCNRLKELSYIYGVGYIETRDCGICPWMAGDAASFVSGGHPTGEGQTRIGEYMARKMLSNL